MKRMKPMDQYWIGARYSDEKLLELYDKMKMARSWSVKLEEALMAGTFMTSLHAALGQESTYVALAAVMENKDWYSTTHRGQIVLYERIGLLPLLREMTGKDTGPGNGTAFDFHLCDYDEDGKRLMCIPSTLGSPIAQTAGFAWARKRLSKDDGVCVCLQGDGGTGEGVVYEGWNLAALYGSPAVFIVENNGWAATGTTECEHANPDLGEKAGACGLPYQVVRDGTNLLECCHALEAAFAMARKGVPNVVEIKNDRWRGHCVGFPDIRTEYEVRDRELYMKYRDPVIRYEEYLKEIGLIDDAYAEKKTAECNGRMEEAFAQILKEESTTYEHAYSKDFIYATPETGEDM